MQEQESTSDSRSLDRLSLVARSSSRGAKCDGQTLVTTKTSSRLTPDARSPSPTSRSLLVHLGGIDVPVAEPQRLLDHVRAGATVPGARPASGMLAPLALTVQWGSSSRPDHHASLRSLRPSTVPLRSIAGLTTRPSAFSIAAISAISAGVEREVEHREIGRAGAPGSRCAGSGRCPAAPSTAEPPARSSGHAPCRYAGAFHCPEPCRARSGSSPSTAMPCLLQRQATLVWSRKGCISIWFVTSGSAESLVASSSIAVVKIADPTCRPALRLGIVERLMLSDNGTFGLFQWIRRRSTNGSSSFLRLSVDRLFEITRRQPVPMTLVTTKTSSRLSRSRPFPDAAPPPPVPRAVAFGRVDVAVAELERGLHGIDADLLLRGSWCQVHGRNADALRFDDVHGMFFITQ